MAKPKFDKSGYQVGLKKIGGEKVPKGKGLKWQKLDKWHYHEVLDRASTLADAVEAQLGEHPVVKAHPLLPFYVEHITETLVAIQRSMATYNAEK